MAKSMKTLVAAALGAAALRSAVTNFAAPRAAGAAPAIVSGKPAREGVAAYFAVTLQTPDGEEKFECPDDVYVLDAAEEAGIAVPYSCCAGKVVSGSIDQSDQAFLDEDQTGDGFCLTCVTYATSDVTIKTHCEDDL